MGNLKIHLYVLFLLNMFSSCLGNQLFGQKNVNISIGIGNPEFINTSVRYQFPERVQVGLGFGFFPVKEGSSTCYSGITYFHFGKLPQLSSLRPWYLRISLDYWRDKGVKGNGDSYNDKYLYGDLRIGRVLNISYRFGIEVDAGIIFDLIEQPSEEMFDMGVLPGFGIRLTYRL